MKLEEILERLEGVEERGEDYDECACGARKQKLSRTCNECWKGRGTKEKRKPCMSCGGPKEAGIRRHLCDACRATRGERRRTRAKDHARSWRMQRVYGITVEQYEEMLARQNGVCAICLGTCDSNQRLAVDHDHVSGKVRALLCRRCNQALGRLNDDPDLFDRAAAYLRRHLAD